MKRQERIRKIDILTIKPGKSEVFVLANPKAVRSAVTYAYQLASCSETPRGVERYATSADYKNNTVIITAVKSE